MTETDGDVDAGTIENPYCQISCRTCGRVTSRLQRVHAAGTGWPYRLCWPCYKKLFGCLPPFEWRRNFSDQTRKSEISARKQFARPRGIKPFLTQKAMAGDEPFCLSVFFNHHLKCDPTCSILFREVVDFYLEWRDATGSPVVPVTAFIPFMESKDCDRITMNGQVYFSNLSFTRLSLRSHHRWDEETRALVDRILTLTPEDLPPTPFDFCQGETVVDSEKYLTAFQNEIRCGEDHPRSCTGVLQDEIRILWHLVSSESTGDG